MATAPGPSPEGRPVHDVDASNAYPAGYTNVQWPDWDAVRMTTDVGELAQVAHGP